MALIFDCTANPTGEFRLDFSQSVPEWAADVMSVRDRFLEPGPSFEVRTSGSTGAPKLIIIPKASLCHSAVLTVRTFGLQPGTRALLCLPTAGIGGLMMVIRAMIGRWHLTCVGPSLDPLADFLGPVDFAAMTPVQALRSIENYPNRWNQIRTVIIGGAPVSERLERMLAETQPACFITYGMTETITHIAIRKPLDSLYTTLPGVIVSTNEDGVLRITADHLPFPVETTDLASIGPDGRFEVLGRADNVINSGGVKIHPEPMEAKAEELISQPFYITSAVHAEFGQVPVLLLEGDISKEQKSYLLERLLTMFGKIASPRFVITTPKFERTETGKIKRWKNIKIN